MLGVVLIDKPLGLTSHDVVNRLRSAFGTRRIGHAGTLDPLATGLLVVAVGPATRFLQYLPLEPKEYVATVRFGAETSTQDLEGEIVAERPVPEDLLGAFNEALPGLTGLIRQIPPIFSAVKKDGKPLYHYARRGEEVERDPRTVHIGEVELLHHGSDTIEVRLTCSGGTYVRTWAHDLGLAMGCGGHLVALRRTKVGKFLLENSTALDQASSAPLIPLHEALKPNPLIELDEAQVEAIRHGRQLEMARLRLDQPDQTVIGMTDARGEIVAMGRVQGPWLQPECVIPALQ